MTKRSNDSIQESTTTTAERHPQGPSIPRRSWLYSTLPPFKYGPRIRSDQIRLLKLALGSPGSAISFDLIVRDRGSSKYHALSYAWGIPIRNRETKCNGQRLMIPSRLDNALSSLREKYADEYLWADAVCINQNDDEEKSVQVRRMASTYSDAESVVVWLGEELYDTALGLRLLEKLCAAHPSANGDDIRNLYLDETSYLFPDGPEQVSQLEEFGVPSDLSSDPWRAASFIFSETWFGRRWILQEVTNARHCVFRVGSHETSPDIILGGAYRIVRFVNYRQALDDLQRRHCDLAVSIVQLMRAEQEPWLHESLADILLETSFFKSSDARDRIFAVVVCLKGFTDPAFWKTPRKQLTNAQWEVSESTSSPSEMLQKVDDLVDYKKSLRDVLIEVALCEQGTDEFPPSMVRNMCYVDVQGPLAGDAPSWVPTWQFSSPLWASLYMETEDPLNDGMYDIEQMEMTVSRDKTILHTKAIIFDKIEEISEPTPEGDGLSFTYYNTDKRTEAAAVEDRRVESRWLVKCRHMVEERAEEVPGEAEESHFRTFLDCYRFGAEFEEDLNPVAAYEAYLRHCAMIRASGHPSYQSSRRFYDQLEAVTSYRNRCWEMDISPEQPGLQTDENSTALEDATELAGVATAWENNEQDQRYGRRFFTSENGRMGWVPMAAKRGDELCVVFGFAIPFAVRKVDAGDGDRYRLLGASYVHQAMDGEIFLDDRLERRTIQFV
ncbi:uncharacterized protein LTR77_009940 [Saxophila tyrrhenica]|uniref:Heterokaryon incompatibility domain-containing protein n=1 Tax=Saxophila tyrrhenica TaxID=1690608 RepID=A0AAV9NWR1_9PEZI|nr:hypothetical protein LTR77_009940 [Saxophila tyrrhenica]